MIDYKLVFIRAMRMYFAPLVGAITGAVAASKAEIARPLRPPKA